MGIAYIGSPVMSILTNGKATNNSKGLIMKMGANQIDYMLQGGDGLKIITGRFDVANKTSVSCYVYLPSN